ncbi:MAG: YdiU family protein [Acidimicrobiales bacterium]
MSTTAPTISLDSHFARELPELGIEWRPEPVPAPELVALNSHLAVELGLDPATLASPAGIAVLSGNAITDGSTPVAMGYAGHQFGGYSPRLGDGRAVLLGEVFDGDGRHRDIHLKGSGRTPWSRGGDGKAALGPMLREFLVAEAMHALGVPTARALSVVTTGELISRDQGPVPGAVLARVAASHVRVGTFEYAARHGDDSLALVERLVDHSIARHYPALAATGAERFLLFLEKVIDAQASLIAHWMSIGFVHGVMNTDNMTISGETIDYGPCAFLDRYEPGAVFSSIDHGGRYAFRNQPVIAQWNLARLAETLLPLIDADADTAVAAATDALTGFTDRYEGHYVARMRAKLGLATSDPTDGELVTDLLSLLEAERLDYTGAFRSLATRLRGTPDVGSSGFGADSAIGEWIDRWQTRLGPRPTTSPRSPTPWTPSTPSTSRATTSSRRRWPPPAKETGPFEALLSAVTDPFRPRPGGDRFAEPAPESFTDTYQTFCGT